MLADLSVVNLTNFCLENAPLSKICNHVSKFMLKFC
jgi:hypothetical protein